MNGCTLTPRCSIAFIFRFFSKEIHALGRKLVKHSKAFPVTCKCTAEIHPNVIRHDTFPDFYSIPLEYIMHVIWKLQSYYKHKFQIFLIILVWFFFHLAIYHEHWLVLIIFFMSIIWMTSQYSILCIHHYYSWWLYCWTLRLIIIFPLINNTKLHIPVYIYTSLTMGLIMSFRQLPQSWGPLDSSAG